MPREILLEMMNDGGRERAGVSATMLGGCQRQTWLEAREPYWIDPEKGWAALRGSIGHAILESQKEPGAIVEQRFQAETRYGPVTGQIDKIHVARKTITDFKTKAEDKRPVTKPQPDHVYQLNVYRWLVKHGWPQDDVWYWDPETGDDKVYEPDTPAGIEIEKLELVYWTFGWVKTVPVPILPDREVEDYVLAGVKAFNRETPPPVPQDRDPVGRGKRGAHPLCKDWCAVREHCLGYLLDEEEF